MRNRIFIVVMLMVIYRLLSHIPIPLAEPEQLQQLISNVFSGQQLLGFLNLLSGGALASLSIMLMGLGPYINASIIMQLLEKAIPKLEELGQDGEMGRRKINQYTRLLSVPLAIIQSIGLILLLRQTVVSSNLGIDITANTSILQWILMVATLTGGSILLMWFGELITEQGIGNGISLMIFAGIVVQLPSMAATLVSTIAGNHEKLNIFGWFTLPISGPGLGISAAIIVTTVIVTFLIVKLNEAVRHVDVSYAKRIQGNRAYGGVDTIIPIKVITAGVIPIIFAVAFLAVPTFVGQLIKGSSNPHLAELGINLLSWFQTPQAGVPTTLINTIIYPLSYFLLVVLFTYFYTGVVFNANQIAENLQKQGGFIPFITPGEDTENYLKKIVNRLNLFGSISLGLLAIMPIIIEIILKTNQLQIGGTGLLIVVAVAIETLRYIDSRALLVTYDEEEPEKIIA